MRAPAATDSVVAGSVADDAGLPDRARILGLDPGSLITGYAVIDTAGGQCTYLACGGIRTSGGALTERLAAIFSAVTEIAQAWQPHEVAVERVFMHRNADSALKLGQARGAALCATLSVAPRFFEYSAREVKQAVVGTGAAQKDQVQLMVKHLLKLKTAPQADAADALAVALCHAYSRRMRGVLSSASQRVRA